MKKAKYIIIAMILTLALLGAAYAAWTQTITINGTATTGSLYVNLTLPEDSVPSTFPFSTDQGSPWYNVLNTYEGITEIGDWGGATTNITLGNKDANDGNFVDSFTITANDVFPGWQALYEVTVTNTGTVPFTLGTPVQDSIKINGQNVQTYNYPPKDFVTGFVWGKNVYQEPVSGGGVGYSTTPPTLNPGDSTTLYVTLALDESYDNTTMPMGQTNFLQWQCHIPVTQATQ